MKGKLDLGTSLFKINMQNNHARPTLELPILCNPLMQLQFKLASDTVLQHQLLNYFALTKLFVRCFEKWDAAPHKSINRLSRVLTRLSETGTDPHRLSKNRFRYITAVLKILRKKPNNQTPEPRGFFTGYICICIYIYIYNYYNYNIYCHRESFFQ